jgi:hypothetical protein
MTLRWVPGWNGLTEPEAVSYVAAVEAADGQELEFGVAKAINDFVLGCKNDGIWDAIKACCILAGARTLNGALVPLVGTAPTNYNFVSGDYDRETGLVGDGSAKYLDSNRRGTDDPLNNQHLSVYAGTLGTLQARQLAGVTGDTVIFDYPDNSQTRFVSRDSSPVRNRSVSNGGLQSVSRSGPTEWVARCSGSQLAYTDASVSASSNNLLIFTAGGNFSNARIAFYSIGESLDLAALDTRVSALITAIGAAIP